MCQRQGVSYYPCGNANYMTFLPYIDDSGKVIDGIAINYGNGDPCNFSPRQSTINIECDKDAGQGTITSASERSTCNYYVYMKSKYACGYKSLKDAQNGGSKKSKSKGAGDYWGWIILSLSITGFVAYIIIGMAVKYKKYDARGVEMIPNINFWKDFPFLIKDGVFFTIQKVSCNKLLADWSPSYSSY
eukprot:TRINITY_DN1321_c1_g1_i1.p1 TRINITY_DN1321_c1_g1~~TRINITY_DN1321_c1_g1_i1.p1  ORF type:complete len:188 (-),score=27.31 TRINITY_DN1321_c1_g1_i1:121-684(-)